MTVKILHDHRRDLETGLSGGTHSRPIFGKLVEKGTFQSVSTRKKLRNTLASRVIPSQIKSLKSKLRRDNHINTCKISLRLYQDSCGWILSRFVKPY